MIIVTCSWSWNLSANDSKKREWWMVAGVLWRRVWHRLVKRGWRKPQTVQMELLHCSEVYSGASSLNNKKCRSSTSHRGTQRSLSHGMNFCGGCILWITNRQKDKKTKSHHIVLTWLQPSSQVQVQVQVLSLVLSPDLVFLTYEKKSFLITVQESVLW